MFTQSIALAGLVSIIGMPHGGLDHLVGRNLLRPIVGGAWWLIFLVSYLFVMVMIAFGWIFAPVGTLLLFVALSSVHFGTVGVFPKTLMGWITAVAQGGIVVSLPALVHPDEMTRLVSIVVPSNAWPTTLLDQFWVRAFLIASSALALATWFESSWKENFPRMGLAIVFILGSPLTSFMVYFCGWHSLTEIHRLVRQADPGSWTRGLKIVLRHTMPLTVSANLLIAIGWWLLFSHQPLSESLIQVVFIGLSVVAVPHLLLCLVSEWANVSVYPVSSESSV